jgi:hypothetical protein
MRRALIGSLWVGALIAASPVHSAPSPGDGSFREAAPKFTLAAEGIPDSLLQDEDEDRFARLWERGELEALAGRLRDRLLRLGRYEATLRLTIANGNGSAPGSARLSLWRPPGKDGGAGRSEPPTVDPPRAVVVVTGAPPAGLSDPARSFERGSGADARPGGIAAGIAAIRDDAVTQGRYAAAVSVDSVVRVEDEVWVHLSIDPGPPVVVEGLELPGATATRPAAAAAIAGLKAGRRITPALLADARERLIGSDLFATVGEPRVLPGREPGRARVLIPVEERNVSHFEGALGVTRDGGLTGLIDLALGNIGGSGRAAGARWAGLGEGRAAYALRYREPALLGKPIDGSFSLDADVADSLFTQTRWALALGGRPAPRARGSVAFARSGSVYAGIGRGSSETWSVTGRIEWQSLSPRMNPASGLAAALELESGNRTERYPGIPEARRGLLRAKASLASAASLGGPRVLYGAVRAERVTLGAGDFPAEELRYVGGSEGLRGHRDRAFAGNGTLIFNVEQRWITDPRGGRAYFFLDVARHTLDAPVTAGAAAGLGAAASLARTELSPGWEVGYGAGLKTRMASGVAGLELGLAPGAALRQATIHVRYTSSW